MTEETPQDDAFAPVFDAALASPPTRRGLYTKLAEVVKATGSVKKRGRNDFHKYDYSTAEDTLREVRQPLAERNIALLPSIIESVREPRGDNMLTTVRLRFTFVDGDTGETHEAEWEGTGEDKADKGHYKAYTGAIRTFLRETFLLPSGDDPEGDDKTDKAAAKRKAPPTPEPQAEPQQNGAVDLDTIRQIRDLVAKEKVTLHEIGLVLVAAGIEDMAVRDWMAKDTFSLGEAKQAAKSITREQADALVGALDTGSKA